MNNHRLWAMLIATFAAIVPVSPVQAGPFDNVLKRMEDTVHRRTEDAGERAVNGVFDQADDAVKCAAGDEACKRREATKQAKVPTVNPAAPARCVATDVNCLTEARERGMKVEIIDAPAPSGPARCIATDVTCLQEAKRRGRPVEIVDDNEVDTIYCSMSDTACMQRAKSLGKKVELVD